MRRGRCSAAKAVGWELLDDVQYPWALQLLGGGLLDPRRQRSVGHPSTHVCPGRWPVDLARIAVGSYKHLRQRLGAVEMLHRGNKLAATPRQRPIHRALRIRRFSWRWFNHFCAACIKFEDSGSSRQFIWYRITIQEYTVLLRSGGWGYAWDG